MLSARPAALRFGYQDTPRRLHGPQALQDASGEADAGFHKRIVREETARGRASPRAGPAKAVREAVGRGRLLLLTRVEGGSPGPPEMLQLHLGKRRLNGRSFQLLNANLPVRRGHTWTAGPPGSW